MKVFAAFDQPDLKATYDVAVTAPERYTVVLNEAVTVGEDAAAGTKTWRTRIDYPLSTYLIAIVAGEYDHLPEAAFYMVGAIEEAVAKAEKMASEA